METKLIELLKICIKKGLSFDYSQVQAICISYSDEDSENQLFYEYVGIYDFWTEERRMKNINELIEKVKNYKKQ